MDLNLKGSEGTVEVSDAIFSVEFNESLVHQVVTAYMAGARAGTKAQKNRSDVAGGGAKPWRQKGTGRARAGTIRSPIWRTGGVTFAARPRSYEQKVNRKMYRRALSVIMAELIRAGRLHVVEDLQLEEPKTRLLAVELKGLESGRTLVIDETISDNVALAARNIPGVSVSDAHQIDPVALVASDAVLITRQGLKKVEAALS